MTPNPIIITYQDRLSKDIAWEEQDCKHLKLTELGRSHSLLRSCEGGSDVVID